MSRLPVLKSSELVRIVRQRGFVFDRQRGSHAVYYHQQQHRRVVIPMHNKDLKPGTLRGIIRDLGLTVEEFTRYCQ